MTKVVVIDEDTGVEVCRAEGVRFTNTQPGRDTYFQAQNGKKFVFPASTDVIVRLQDVKLPQTQVQRTDAHIRAANLESQMVQLNTVMAALVRAMGGAVIITDHELVSADGTLLVSFHDEHGLNIKLKED